MYIITLLPVFDRTKFSHLFLRIIDLFPVEVSPTWLILHQKRGNLGPSRPIGALISGDAHSKGRGDISDYHNNCVIAHISGQITALKMAAKFNKVTFVMLSKFFLVKVIHMS